MTQQAYAKPLPTPQPESDFYWEKCKEHELWLRSCNDCNQPYFYPRDICPDCFSRNTTWVRASGRGTLHTFAIVHRAPTPAFRDDAPFVVAIVDLEEGPRMPTNLRAGGARPLRHPNRHAGGGSLRGRHGGHHPPQVPACGVGARRWDAP